MCMFRMMKCWFRYSSHLIWGGQARAAPYKLIVPSAKPSQRLSTTMFDYKLCKIWVRKRGPDEVAHLQHHKFCLFYPKEPSAVANIIVWTLINELLKLGSCNYFMTFVIQQRGIQKDGYVQWLRHCIIYTVVKNKQKTPSTAGFWCKKSKSHREITERHLIWRSYFSSQT